jgi:hypothetical protein
MNFLKRAYNYWMHRASDERGFIQAVPYMLQGMSALGGIFGKKKKYLDPEMMRQRYGPAAIGRDAQELSNQILNSPYGQQLMASAATQGQDLQSAMAGNAAKSGLDPSTGGESGASTFATGAAQNAQSGLERGARADAWKMALPVVAGMNQNLQGLEESNNAEQNATPNMWQRIGSAAGQASSLFPGQKKTA